jgi:hypothetical protein
MKTTLMTAALAGGTILALQALAQLPTRLPGAAGNAMSTAGSMAKGVPGCQGLIDQASSMIGTLQGGLKTSALGEISQAKSFLSAGNESACMTHANKAMGLMK